MPNMQKKDVIGIFLSDVHLSHRAPAARENEPDWYECMRRQLKEVRELQKKHECSVIIAGDIFDRPDPPPELINFAIQEMPNCYAVAGQHDLFYHNMDNIHKTAYWTLVEAMRIVPLGLKMNLGASPPNTRIQLYGFNWNERIANRSQRSKLVPRIAVVHKYIWSSKRNSHPHASEEHYVTSFREKLKGYDVAFFGDNHKPFQSNDMGCQIINCGAFMRRKADEQDSPRVYLLDKYLNIDTYFLKSCENDIVSIPEHSGESESLSKETKEFLRQITEMKSKDLDFVEATMAILKSKSVNKEVEELVMSCLED